VFENMVLSGRSNGDCRKLQNEELLEFYFSKYISG